MLEEKMFMMIDGGFGAKDPKMLDTYHGLIGVEFHADTTIDAKVKELRRNGAAKISVWYNYTNNPVDYCAITYRSDGNLEAEPDKMISCYLGTIEWFKKTFDL